MKPAGLVVWPTARPCVRCGRDAPIYRFRLEHLRLIGWRLFAPVEYVNWCGRAQKCVALPEGDGGAGWCPCSARRGEHPSQEQLLDRLKRQDRA